LPVPLFLVFISVTSPVIGTKHPATRGSSPTLRDSRCRKMRSEVSGAMEIEREEGFRGSQTLPER
jgi:hypothetical protein